MEDTSTDEPSAPPDRDARERALSLVGRVISERYRIDELLAMGGMGAVYRGRHLRLKKRVAVKVLRPETDNLPELVARFEREAIAGAHVAHANVAAATDFGQLDDGSFFLVLEYVSGRPLHLVIKQGPLPAARAVAIARQIAAGLAAAHAMGIVHRDVKPRNVMLVERSEDLAKLIDFGLAKVPVDRVVAHQSIRPVHDGGSAPEPPRAASLSGLEGVPPLRRPRLDSLQDSKPRLTGVGMIVGTVAYLAPEAALGMDAVDARSDLYALGLVLYQMLAGRHPWDADNDAALFAHQRFTPPPPFAERAPTVSVPPALEAVVMKLLEKEPGARYPTGTAVVEALDAALVAGPPAAAASQWYVLVAVGAVAIAVGVAAALVFNASSRIGAGPVLAAAPRPTAPLASLALPKGGAPTTSVSAEAVTEAVAVTASSTASAPAPVAASATASASAPVAAAFDASIQRLLLLRALRVRDWNGGEAAFLELVAHSPAVFHDPAMALAARDLALALDREGRGDRLFDALTRRLGSDGLDVLYDLVATKGRAGAAVRAGAVLRQKDVLARATPEMRIAFALREAPCVDKLGLLDRAAAEGDGRALIVLQTQGVACFKKNNRPVQDAMAALRTRLRRGQ